MNKFNSIILLAGLAFSACRPTDHKKVDLPNPSTADFSVTMLNGDPNTYVVENTTSGAFISSWTFETIGKSQQSKDTIFFARKGSYSVSLNTSSKGGASSITKTIDVPSTSPLAADFKVTDIGNHKFEVEVVTPNPSGIVWSFSNGTGSVGQAKDTVYFPFAGENPVTLTIQTPNGPSVFTKSIAVSETDQSNPDLTDANLILLTGGLSATNGKTWVVDAGSKKSNVGPGTNVTGSYYNYPDGLTGDPFVKGMLDNEYTFKMDKYQYIPKTKNVSMGGQFSDIFFGTSHVDFSNTDDSKNGTYNTYNQVDPKHIQAPFVWKKDDWDYIKDKDQTRTTGITMQIGNGSYLGWFSNNNKYFIVKIKTDTMYVGHYYSDHAKDNPADFSNGRYFTFVVKK